MKSTVVEMTCSEKKTSQSAYNKKTDGSIDKQNTIVFDLPFDKTNIYYQLSGGTKVELNTISQEAADMFVVGNKYKFEISTIE